MNDQRLATIAWNGGAVVVRFPEVFPWKDPDNPYLHQHEGKIFGVISCGRCGFRKKHCLNWPNDAYFRFDTVAGELWAYTREHLVQIYRYVSGDRHRQSAFDLNRLPKEFLLARHRDRLLRQIELFLEGT